jgi:cysteinyl-tRNA synthetase
MSKSLGNFFTIRDLLKENKPEVLRYFMISSHYRSPVQYSEHALVQAHQALTRFYNTLRDLPDAEPLANSEYEQKFIAAMNDDFNTPIAFSVLFELAHEVQRLRDKDLSLAAQYGSLLKLLGGVFGILQDHPEQFLQGEDETLPAAKIESMIAARNQARAEKKWGEADRIRDELLALSVVLEDAASGTKWKRVVKEK